MPELPEVETVRKQLEPLLLGRKIIDVRVPDLRIIAPANLKDFRHSVIGQEISVVGRRGKYLLLHFQNSSVLVLHLRMTGRLTHTTDPGAIDQRHLRLVIGLADGNAVAFHDQRRFGTAFVLRPAQSQEYWHRLGPEPLGRSFTAKSLAQILDARQRPIKPLLLDQHLIAGIGNIYADESLYRAGIHPLRSAASLDPEEIQSLTRAIKQTLRRAIKLEGSSIDTYRTASGEQGRFQETFKVHRRAGERCPGCGCVVEKIRVGGRGTYFCPSCQKI